MIIKIFKIETLEMCMIRHKKGLVQFIRDELDIYLSKDMTVNQLLKYLPKERYYQIK